MEPLSIMKSIFKVAQEINKAARTARRNKSRCLELADRVRTVGDILRDSNAASDTARGRALGRLKDALADAFKLVESCSRRSCWLSRLLASGRQADRFHDVETRINSCVADLGIANDARLEKLVNELDARHHPSTNARAGSVTSIPSRTGDAGMYRPPPPPCGGDPQHHQDTGKAEINHFYPAAAAAGRKGSMEMKEMTAVAAPPPMPSRTGDAGMYWPLPPPPCGGDPQYHQDTGAPFCKLYVFIPEEEYSCSVM